MKQKQKKQIEELFKVCEDVFYGDAVITDIVLDEETKITSVKYKKNSVDCEMQNGYFIVEGFPIKFLSEDIIDKIINEIDRKISKRVSDRIKFEDKQYCDVL